MILFYSSSVHILFHVKPGGRGNTSYYHILVGQLVGVLTHFLEEKNSHLGSMAHFHMYFFVLSPNMKKSTFLFLTP